MNDEGRACQAPAHLIFHPSSFIPHLAAARLSAFSADLYNGGFAPHRLFGRRAPHR